jgi:uncharacterized protein YabN with tetrapyrrole methylase and pyrophosphatase domain
MTAPNPLPYDIAVVGLGIVGTHQITREVEETIRRCTETFVIDTAVGVVGYLRGVSPKVTSLVSTYVPGKHRRLIYRDMAGRVIAAAKESPPVCFAAYGHPRFYCQPSALIQRAAMVLNLKTAVLPGISSIDVLFAEIGLDPGFDGLQMYDATDIVVRRRPLQTDVSCVLMQAPLALQPYNRPGMPNLNDLLALQNYLLEFYPADHLALLVTTRTHPLLQSTRAQVPVGRLAEALQRTASMATLLIPPVRHRDIADQSLADRLKPPATGAVGQPQLPRRPGRPPIGPAAPAAAGTKP